MASALLPLLLTISVVAFVAILTVLFLQFSKPGHRLVPCLVIALGIALGAVLFLLKLKAFSLVAVVSLVVVGFILASTAEEQFGSSPPPLLRPRQPDKRSRSTNGLAASDQGSSDQGAINKVTGDQGAEDQGAIDQVTGD